MPRTIVDAENGTKRYIFPTRAAREKFFSSNPQLLRDGVLSGIASPDDYTFDGTRWIADNPEGGSGGESAAQTPLYEHNIRIVYNEENQNLELWLSILNTNETPFESIDGILQEYDGPYNIKRSFLQSLVEISEEETKEIIFSCSGAFSIFPYPHTAHKLQTDWVAGEHSESLELNDDEITSFSDIVRNIIPTGAAEE
jgi:hypothetical protein